MSRSGRVVLRTAHVLLPDPRRVLAKPFLPGEEVVRSGTSRAGLLVDRVLGLSEAEVVATLADVLARFSARHAGLEQLLARHFDRVKHHIAPGTPLSRARRLLIGAYFTHEFAVEAAALFNPSLVLAPGQDDLPPGPRRFVMSLRAVGEGHTSSIEFRTGTIDAGAGVTFDPVRPSLVSGWRTHPESYDKHLFGAKLRELGADEAIAWSVLDRLPDAFTADALDRAVAALDVEGPSRAARYETVRLVRVLAASNYVTRFPAGSELAQRVLFPAGPHETRGMEDARFVRFVDDDGSATYFATYTAFDGFGIMPQLIETADFVSFRISTLNGEAAQNKGMALFPRRVDGKYVMLSRRDQENLHLATSDNVRFWNEATEFQQPSRAWELMQIGNCGSPLETEAGWLVLTHGVGPMRRYVLSALLLDLADPRKVIGCLPVPLLEPDETEREGYVPNVVYSCGGLIHGETLVLPYGFSDHGVRIAHISIPGLLAELLG